MSRAWDQAQEEFACNCMDKQLRVKQFKNGTKHYGEQCLYCGVFVLVKKAKLTSVQQSLAQPFDEQLARGYQEARSERFRELCDQEYHEQRQVEKQQYDAYMASDEWRDRRRRVLDRDQNTCQACLRRPGQQVHHLTYKRFGQEPLFDLIAVCYICHKALHEDRDP